MFEPLISGRISDFFKLRNAVEDLLVAQSQFEKADELGGHSNQPDSEENEHAVVGDPEMELCGGGVMVEILGEAD